MALSDIAKKYITSCPNPTEENTRAFLEAELASVINEAFTNLTRKEYEDGSISYSYNGAPLYAWANGTAYKWSADKVMSMTVSKEDLPSLVRSELARFALNEASAAMALNIILNADEAEQLIAEPSVNTTSAG